MMIFSCALPLTRDTTTQGSVGKVVCLHQDCGLCLSSKGGDLKFQPHTAKKEKERKRKEKKISKY